MDRVRISIRGRVQGVFFRASAKETADRLGIRGWIKNMPDGSVQAVAEGDTESVGRFIEWCNKGPERAEVTKVDVERERATGEFNNFVIEY